jgi:hypothetical protein
MENQGGSSQTGTRDTTYDLTAVLYHALQGVENCQTYQQDAGGGDHQIQQFFQQAAEQQRQLAEQAKQLLHDCLMRETQGGQGGQQSGSGSAFGFGQQGSQQIGQQSEMAGGQSGGTSGSSSL